jgi:hypothetical protein
MTWPPNAAAASAVSRWLPVAS